MSPPRSSSEAAQSDEKSPIDLGKSVHDDLEFRRIQAHGNGVRVNLTQFGKRYHGLEQNQPVRVVVCERGIGIIPVD